MENKFDNIRPYRSDEIQSVLKGLIEEKQFMKVVSTIFPLMPKPVLKEKISSFDDVEVFQKEMIYPYLKYLEANKTEGIKINGFEKLVDNKQYLFITNHRDIVLDSSFLCMKFIENNRKSVEIAIGDNLFVFPWIKDLVRINKSFIVKRGLTPREILSSSKELSAYINYAINEKEESVWIAQREGRAKDANDRTQTSLLKMLALSGESKSFIENLKALNICPITINYEYDPCDFLKAKEFQQKRDDSEYKKMPQDDLINMRTGILGYKGHVVYNVSECINDELDKIQEQTDNKNEQVKLAIELIDKKIHSNYEIFPINKWAYDKAHNTKSFINTLSTEEVDKIDKYIKIQLEKVDLEHNDKEFLLGKIVEMYANPLKNKISVLGADSELI